MNNEEIDIRIAEQDRNVILNWKNIQLDKLGLTIKEREVAELLLKGYSNKEIANQLGNTEKTMKHHVASIFHKANVDSRTKLFAQIFCL